MMVYPAYFQTCYPFRPTTRSPVNSRSRILVEKGNLAANTTIPIGCKRLLGCNQSSVGKACEEW